MAQPTGNEPDFLPDGSLSIHGRKAKKFHVGMNGNQDGAFMPDFPSLERTLPETLAKASDEMNEAWKGKTNPFRK